MPARRFLSLQALGLNQSLRRLLLQRLSRMPQHMLARCTQHSHQSAVRNLALILRVFRKHCIPCKRYAGGSRHCYISHLDRFSSRSSLTSLGSCTDTGMMLPGNSGRLGSGTASTCAAQPLCYHCVIIMPRLKPGASGMSGQPAIAVKATFHGRHLSHKRYLCQ